MKHVLFYVKEQGTNKFLFEDLYSGDSSISVNKSDMELITKMLGHKPDNIYFLYEGKEFLFPMNLAGKTVKEVREWLEN